MKADLFDYELPSELIATHPPAERDGARLLVLGPHGIEHRHVREIGELVPSGALVVLNETRVRRARLACLRPLGPAGEGGGRVELLLLGPTPQGLWRALGRANRPLRPGDRVTPAAAAPGLGCFEVLGREADGTLELRAWREDGTEASAAAVEEAAEVAGEMPIPPYLQRAAEPEDAERYQTVFARELGSVAAPTAGLHLTAATLERLRGRGVHVGKLVLHVGVGTFRPVTADDLDAHDMHSEQIQASAELAAQVAEARQRGAPVIAIGTTVVRALETVADPERPGHIRPYVGSTRLLIQPGYEFRVVDGLLTNFHMPKSTLLALVSAFAGRERILDAYRQAVARGYRFLSYGDAMWLPERLS